MHLFRTESCNTREVKIFTEDTAKEYLKDADIRSIENSKAVSSKLITIQFSRQPNSVLVYQSKTSGKTWQQLIYVPRMRAKMPMFGIKKYLGADLLVYCNCPAFKWWGYNYIQTSRNNIIKGKGNTRFPKTRNPNLTGSVCKHLVKVLTILPDNARDIYRILNKE